jgi:Pyruvate dehydrogenase complex, dehydrogenase (E1) component
VRLLGSGAILNEVLAAANRLREQWGVTVQVWSVTSFSELERDARSAQHARLAGAQTTVSAPFKVLGTDGFGCSDTPGAPCGVTSRWTARRSA